MDILDELIDKSNMINTALEKILYYINRDGEHNEFNSEHSSDSEREDIISRTQNKGDIEDKHYIADDAIIDSIDLSDRVLFTTASLSTDPRGN